MFINPLTLVYRFVFIAILTVTLMILDHRTRYFEMPRNLLSNINTPFNTVLTTPVRFRTFYEDYWPNKVLLERVARLEAENQRLQLKEQKFNALEIEKNRLLVLFSASQSRGDVSVRMGRIIRTTLGRYDQRITIDLGERDGVLMAQPVIDSNGVIGQVSIIARDHSVVTAISDASHAVPVEVLRNGLRAVARGTGRSQLLTVPFLSLQADIEVGDVLVTSGLGDVFPAGYPVAEISSVEAQDGEPFLSVKATPYAEMNKVKNILLVDEPLLSHIRGADEDGLSKDEREAAQSPVETGNGTPNEVPLISPDSGNQLQSQDPQPGASQ